MWLQNLGCIVNYAVSQHDLDPFDFSIGKFYCSPKVCQMVNGSYWNMHTAVKHAPRLWGHNKASFSVHLFLSSRPNVKYVNTHIYTTHHMYMGVPHSYSTYTLIAKCIKCLSAAIDIRECYKTEELLLRTSIDPLTNYSIPDLCESTDYKRRRLTNQSDTQRSEIEKEKTFSRTDRITDVFIVYRWESLLWGLNDLNKVCIPYPRRKVDLPLDFVLLI